MKKTDTTEYKLEKLRLRAKRLELRPKDKPHLRPNVLVALAVFCIIVVTSILVAHFNPESYTSELNAMVLAALAIIAGLFNSLTKSEEAKDDSLSDLAKTLAKNGSDHKQKEPEQQQQTQTIQSSPATHIPSFTIPQKQPKDFAKSSTIIHTPFLQEVEGQEPAVAKSWSKEDGSDHDFEAVFVKTLKHEGEWLYSIDTDGNPVYSGINQGHNPDWDGWELLDDVKPPETGHIVVDKPELRELVKQRYKRNYWDHKVCAFFSEWPELRQHVYDTVVRGGYSWRLQETCVKCGVKADVDGLWGPGTKNACMEAIEKVGWRDFNNLLMECRLAYVDRTVKKKLVPANMAKGLRARMRSWKV